LTLTRSEFKRVETALNCLGKDVMEKVEADKVFEPSFRDFALGAKLIACAKTVPLTRPCVLRYFG
jgi:hypothetical protein